MAHAALVSSLLLCSRCGTSSAGISIEETTTTWNRPNIRCNPSTQSLLTRETYLCRLNVPVPHIAMKSGTSYKGYTLHAVWSLYLPYSEPFCVGLQRIVSRLPFAISTQPECYGKVNGKTRFEWNFNTGGVCMLAGGG